MDFDYSKKPNKIRRKWNGEVEKPIISIITPYYNGGEFIEETINSIMGQTFPFFEMLIIDDCSTDESSIQKLSEFEKIDSRIRVIRKEENSGVSDTRNIGVKECKGEYLCFIDCDDLISETYLEKLYFALITNKDASWAYTDSLGFGQLEYLWLKKFDCEKFKNENLITVSCLIKKSDFVEVGGFETSEKKLFEDWLLWLRLMSKGKFPVHIEGLDFWYRRRDGGLVEINSDPQKVSTSLKLIELEAKKIKSKISAVEYPQISRKSFEKPKEISYRSPVVVSDNKKRMLMMIPHMEMGGSDLFNVDLISRINKDEYEVSIITTVHSKNTWKQRFVEHATDVFELPNFLDVEYWASFIENFIVSRKIDVLMVTNSYFGYYLIPQLRSKFKNLAIVDYVHMEEWYWRNGGYARTAGALSEILEKTYVCNEKTRQVLINDFGRKPESVETVYIGVDEKEFDPDIATEDVKVKHGVEQSKKVVLFPCRIHPQKRPYLMLEIAKRVYQKNKDIVFMVVGDGPQFEEVQEKATKNVVFAGRQSDMKSYYKASDVTLICSIKEGLALTAYESMSMGVPVITSDVGGQGELIDNNVGYIFPMMQDEEDIDNRNFDEVEINQYVNAILELLENSKLQNEKAIKSREKIVQGFTKEKMVKHFETEIDWLKEPNEKRKENYEMLNKYPNLVNDYLTIFNEYLRIDLEIETIWNAKCYFENLYFNLKDTKSNNKTQMKVMSSDEDSELQRLYSMRSVKLALKYQAFMNNNVLGRFLSRIKRLFLK